MIEISFWKFFLVLLVALLVLGPEQLIKVAKKAGRLLAQFKVTAKEFQNEINTIESDTSTKESSKPNRQD